MSRRAFLRPDSWKSNLLLALAMGSATILLGCGGGGGGNGGPGPTPGDCGSSAGSTTPVLCGRVYRDGTTTGVAGATITLLNAAGQALTNQTYTTLADGTFKINPATTSAALFRIDPPTVGFNANTSRYNGSVYAYYTQNQAKTGPCVMSLGTVPNGDKNLGTIFVFPDATPPPPPTGCPR